MNMHKVLLAVLGVLLMASSAQATVLTGKLHSSYPEYYPVLPTLLIGDIANHLGISWDFGGSHKGFFNGRNDGYEADSAIAFATGVTDISQIKDASIFHPLAWNYVGPLCDAVCDPDGVGDFIVLRSISTGHYGVLRIDDIQYSEWWTSYDEFGSLFFRSGSLNGTWWFQTDGTGDFSSVSSVPEPSSYMLFGVGLLVFLGYRVRHKGIK